jgi:diketogulonate reductase-like aldo/keto reductase
MSVTVIGDGAVGLLAVLAAKRLGAEQIVLMGRHQARTDLGREFGATDVVSARGEEGITAVRELTGGHGSSAVLECVGHLPAYEQARGVVHQVHRPRPDTDVEETLGALTDLVRAGKVRYIGSSSYSASQIVEAQRASRERHLERFVTEQPPYSILVRGIEEDVLPTTQRHGMGTLAYSPLAGGWLSGRWRKDAAAAPTSSARPSARFDMSNPANQRKLDIVEELAQLAEQAGMTLIEMAIAFVLNHPGVTSAIVGPRTMEQLKSYLPAADITLSTEVLDRIDELVAPGVTLNPDDNSYGDHTLTPAARRR